MSKVRMPKLQVITISEEHNILIAERVYGKLFIKLLNDDNTIDEEGGDINIPDYSGEYVLISVPKKWIGKKVLVKYDREVDAEVLKINTPNQLYYIDDGEVKSVRWFDCKDLSICL